MVISHVGEPGHPRRCLPRSSQRGARDARLPHVNLTLHSITLTMRKSSFKICHVWKKYAVPFLCLLAWPDSRIPTGKAIRSGLVAIGAASQLQLRDASVQDAECMLASSQIDVLRAASCC